MASIGHASPVIRPKLNNAKKFLSLQLSQTGHAISAEFNSMLRNQALARKRRKVINEIFTTEKTYQEHLNAITSQFLTPLRLACLLPSNVINTIFSNVEAIQAVNRELLSHMEVLGVADAFLALAPFIKLYSTYANSFGQASTALQEWEKKSSEFCSFKAKQESLLECKGLKLAALLITPVQRVPRYKLLLESLLNKTPQDHPDFEKLQEATVEINRVASHINENIRQHENFQKMLSIQNSLSREGAPKILAPGRLFIKEGPLLKVCSRGSQERMFFLFSDILLYGKKASTLDKDQCSYTCRRVFPLIECELEQVFGSSTETGTPCSDVGALFKITCKDKSLLLYSKSKHQATSWFRDIRNAISELKTCRASLRAPRRESALGTRVTPLRRSAAISNKLRYRRGQAGQVSEAECSSPSICIKDTLYPMRKELQAKLNATIKTPLKNKETKSKKETVINSPWIKPGGNNASAPGVMTRSQKKKQTLANNVMTRAQKRKLSGGNSENEVFTPKQGKKQCFKPRLDVSCVQKVRTPLQSVYSQVKHTPAKLRTTTYVVPNQDLVESTSCTIM